MYTTEKNIQILISLLKQYGIRKVVASPGATNFTLVGSLQNDPFFEMYSCVDERSAAYMAIGMSEEANEPVILSCTGATASRNYMSGLTEAYYRKLPIVAITSMEPRTNVGHLRAQQIDRSVVPNDIATESVYLPPVKDEEDAYQCMLSVNKALLALSHRGGGPVHIDIASTMGALSHESIKSAKVIKRVTQNDHFPQMPNGKIAVMIGAHKRFNEEETKAIDLFCSSHNAIVLCVNPCSFSGKYAFRPGLLFAQLGIDQEYKSFDLLIHFGEVSSDYVGFAINAKEVWRISEDGCLKDRYRSLSYIFEMPDLVFFNHYNIEDRNDDTLLLTYKKALEYVQDKLPDLPFSNCWIAQKLAPILPDNSDLYLGIVNSLRVWDYANLPISVSTHANVGGYGIDGCLSTMIGSSLVNPQKEFYGIFGDLAFFYDCNVLGNRHIGQNLHILVVNNDGGQQFRNFDHPASSLGDKTNEYVAAAGHYGAQSSLVIKHLSQDFGFNYFAVNNKEEFEDVVPYFFKKGVSTIVEVFVNDKSEGEAIKMIRNIVPYKNGVKQSVKKVIIDKLGSDKINAIKKILE